MRFCVPLAILESYSADSLFRDLRYVILGANPKDRSSSRQCYRDDPGPPSRSRVFEASIW